MGVKWVFLARPSSTTLHSQTESCRARIWTRAVQDERLAGESNATIHKAARRGQPVTLDSSLSVTRDKVVDSINGSILAGYNKGAVVGSGKLKSTNGSYGFRFAHNTDVFVSGLVLSTN